MKKTISILLFASIIFSVFATATNLSSTKPEAPNAATASTTVSLNLSENYATVWFSRGANKEAIPVYALSLKNPGSLKQDTSGNGGQDDNIYAGSDESTENGLFINWNIISYSNVLITLKIKSPLSQDGATNKKQKIGWTVSWKYTESNDPNGSNKSISFAADSTASEAVSDVYKKNGSIYGEGGSKQITIETDNVWDKDKTKEYSAILYAEITTTE